MARLTLYKEFLAKQKVINEFFDSNYCPVHTKDKQSKGILIVVFVLFTILRGQVSRNINT